MLYYQTFALGEKRPFTAEQSRDLVKQETELTMDDKRDLVHETQFPLSGQYQSNAFNKGPGFRWLRRERELAIRATLSQPVLDWNPACNRQHSTVIKPTVPTTLKTC